MKGLIILGVITLFLLGFIAAGITSKAIENGSSDSSVSPSASNEDNPEVSTAEHNSVISAYMGENNSKPRLTEEQKRKLILERNRLKFENKTGVACPDNCSCNGKTVKCLLPNGGRELTIYAGKSGNIIVQVKGENMTTNVALYKANDGKIYAVNKNNETREIKLLPDQVKERIREKLARQLENENITLNENGTYQYRGEHKARLFLIIPVKEVVNAQLDSQTGQIIQLKKPWWTFLAREEGQQLVGASCGTVTPGQNDACCKTKNYDFWNMTAGECQFNSSN
jgi:hypothetical protein